MPDNSNPIPNSGDNVNNSQEPSAGGGGTGSDPKKATPPASTFDVAKLGDEDFEKVFDDPRVWNHPRFKQLNERAKKAQELEAAEAKREEERLKKEGKLAELNEKLTRERDEALAKANARLVEMQVVQQAQLQGAIDTEAVLKLIDMTALTPDEHGNVQGVDKAVEALLTAKPFLKSTSAPKSIGSPTNPGHGSDQPKRFKHSQLQDPIFYRENEKEILEALRLGLIENDM